jgi:hypothetical protein
MRKLLAIFLIFTSFRIFMSCCKGDGYAFRWSQFDLVNLNHTSDRPVPLTGNTTSISLYGIRLKLEDERVARNFGLGFNQAYAFDCSALFENRDTIASIDVVTRNDFDNTHPAGSSVGNYILARPTAFYSYYPEYTYKSLPEVLPFLNDSQDKFIHNNSVDLRFQNATPIPGQHKFIVTVRFRNGRSLVDSTEIGFN